MFVPVWTMLLFLYNNIYIIDILSFLFELRNPQSHHLEIWETCIYSQYHGHLVSLLDYIQLGRHSSFLHIFYALLQVMDFSAFL